MACDPAHRQAMELAWTALRGLDPREAAKAAGGELREGEVVLTSLGGEVLVDLRDRLVIAPEHLSGAWALVSLHHLKGCLGWKKDDTWVSFEQLPGSRPFASAFRERAVAPLAVRFGEMPKEIVKAARTLGGRPLAMGDAAVVLPVFPRLRAAVVIWQGDGEIPGGANMLFERGGAGTLPLEDLAEIGIGVCQALLSKAR